MFKIFGIRKSTLKKILTVGVSLFLVAAAIGGCVALFGRETSTIGSTKFSRGGIDRATGDFVETSTSVVTKEAFLCQGLRVVPDFTANGEFEVFFYDVNGSFLESSGVQTSTYNGACPAAVYARVMYTPEKPADVKPADWKIGLLDVGKYAKQLTVTVSKEQVEYKSSSNLYVANATTGGFNEKDINTLDNDVNYQASQIIELDGKYDLYMIYVKVASGASVDTNVAFGFGEDGKSAIYLDERGKVQEGYAYTFQGKDMLPDNWYSVVVEVPYDASALRIQGPVNAEYQIYGVTVK